MKWDRDRESEQPPRKIMGQSEAVVRTTLWAIANPSASTLHRFYLPIRRDHQCSLLIIGIQAHARACARSHIPQWAALSLSAGNSLFTSRDHARTFQN